MSLPSVPPNALSVVRPPRLEPDTAMVSGRPGRRPEHLLRRPDTLAECAVLHASDKRLMGGANSACGD